MSSKSGSGGSSGGAVFFWVIFWFAQMATYIMSGIRWFGTHHDTFWFGFKEMIWAVVPVVNFSYVWDWWVAGFMLLADFLRRVDAKK